MGMAASSTACNASKLPASDGVIVMLVPPRGSVRIDGGSDWCCALRGLRSLRYVRDGGSATVRVIHDVADALSPAHLRELSAAAAPRALCTTAVNLAALPAAAAALRDGATRRRPWATPMRRSPSRWGYHHMIRFFFYDLFERPLFDAGHRFWMRLDSDAEFERPLDDPFEPLRRSRALGYLHHRENEDCGPVAEGLAAFAAQWAASEALPPMAALNASSPKCVRGFYNNAEVGRLESFRSPRAARFRAAVLRDGGIYHHRWGDALLRRITVEADGLPIAPLPDDFKRAYQHSRGFYGAGARGESHGWCGALGRCRLPHVGAGAPGRRVHSLSSGAE